MLVVSRLQNYQASNAKLNNKTTNKPVHDCTKKHLKMKHSKKEKAPRSFNGFSKGKNSDMYVRIAPIMIEDILSEEKPHDKSDTTIREINIRTNPEDANSPIIKRRFKPLDNPKSVVEVLQ